ncbi:MAG: DUF1905 domain-containing protein [Micrococcales bacterium]
MEFSFTGELIEWRGPAPFYFVAIPDQVGSEIKASARLLTYGWGVIPVSATIGKTSFTTSLIPRNGVYLLPVKNAARIPEKLELGQQVDVAIKLG